MVWLVIAIYTSIDAAMLRAANHERISGSDSTVESAYQTALNAHDEDDEPLSSRDRDILDGIRRQQHGYVAELKELSLCDLADAHDDGVLTGQEFALKGGYGTLIK